jgi:hypothetical protein
VDDDVIGPMDQSDPSELRADPEANRAALRRIEDALEDRAI